MVSAHLSTSYNDGSFIRDGNRVFAKITIKGKKVHTVKEEVTEWTESVTNDVCTLDMSTSALVAPGTFTGIFSGIAR